MKSQNKISKSVLFGLVTSAMLGCDRRVTSLHTATTKPAVSQAASIDQSGSTAIVASYPILPPAVFSIDGRDELFPAAKLVVLSHGPGGITFRLCSDDPATAIEPGYTGNNFVLDMRLAIDQASDIATSNWDFRSSDGDDVSGIFLHGTRDQYRPVELHIAFQKEGTGLLAYMTGIFSRLDNQNIAAPPERVQIMSYLHTSMPLD